MSQHSRVYVSSLKKFSLIYRDFSMSGRSTTDQRVAYNNAKRFQDIVQLEAEHGNQMSSLEQQMYDLEQLKK